MRQRQHLVGHPPRTADGAHQALEGAPHLLWFVLALAVLGLRAEHRQRRADLVRRIGKEAPARRQHRRQAFHVPVDGVDQRLHFGGNAGALDRRQIVLLARADGVAQADQRLEGRAQRQGEHHRAQRHQQQLPPEAVEKQLLRQRHARFGGLGKDDGDGVAARQRRIVEPLAQHADAHGVAAIGGVAQHQRLLAAQRGRRDEIVVAGHGVAIGTDHGVEHPLLHAGLEHLEGRIRHIHRDDAFERMDPLGDRLDRCTQRTVVGAIDRVERPLVGERRVDGHQHQQGRQQPACDPLLQAALTHRALRR